MLRVSALLVSSLALVGFVSAHPASPLAIAVVTEQFKNAKIVPDVLPGFAPIGLLTLNYTGLVNRTKVGDILSKSITSTAPLEAYIRGTEESEAAAGGPFNVTTIKYTLITFDAGPPGAKNDTGYNLHWLANDWTYGENSDHTVTLNPPSESVVAYAGPAPPSGSGPHRYITLVYPQPDTFTPPGTPAAGSGVALFNLTQYLADSGLTAAIAGTYFTVEEGTATVSVAATTAVDSTTLPQYTPSSTPVQSGNAAVTADNVGSALSVGVLGMLLGLCI